MSFQKIIKKKKLQNKTVPFNLQDPYRQHSLFK